MIKNNYFNTNSNNGKPDNNNISTNSRINIGNLTPLENKIAENLENFVRDKLSK